MRIEPRLSRVSPAFRHTVRAIKKANRRDMGSFTWTCPDTVSKRDPKLSKNASQT